MVISSSIYIHKYLYIQSILASLEEASAITVLSEPPPPSSSVSASDTMKTPTLSSAEEECLQGMLFIV